MYVKGTFQEQKSYVALPVFGKVFLRLSEAPAVRLLPCTSRPSLWSWFANATGCEVDNRIWHFFAIFRQILEFTHFYHPEIAGHADLSRFFLSISSLAQETWWVHSKNHVPARCRSLNSDRIGRNWAKTNGFVWIGGPPKSKMSSSSFFNIWSLIPWNCRRDSLKIPETSKNKHPVSLPPSPPRLVASCKNLRHLGPMRPAQHRCFRPSTENCRGGFGHRWIPSTRSIQRPKNQQICTVGVRIWEVGWKLEENWELPLITSYHFIHFLCCRYLIRSWNGTMWKASVNVQCLAVGQPWLESPGGGTAKRISLAQGQLDSAAMVTVSQSFCWGWLAQAVFSWYQIRTNIFFSSMFL